MALKLLSAHAQSPSMQAVLERIEQCAKLPLPVLISGETGTGKEVAALALHTPKAGAHPFVALNCGALESNLAHSELFGHRKGAFTGASAPRAGAFARAGQGTLFLDELGELPPELQSKLLRVLENGTFLPLGAECEQKSQARIVAATHRSLQHMVQTGHFRQDLLFRLRVITIELPALRERQEDIPSLLQHFVDRAAKVTQLAVKLRPCATGFVQTQMWPGNLRELWHSVLRAAIHAKGSVNAQSLREAMTIAHPRTLSPEIPQLHVAKSSFADMKQDILRQSVRDAGSIRQAAINLQVPKSTLADWLAPPQKPANDEGAAGVPTLATG